MTAETTVRPVHSCEMRFESASIVVTIDGRYRVQRGAYIQKGYCFNLLTALQEVLTPDATYEKFSPHDSKEFAARMSLVIGRKGEILFYDEQFVNDNLTMEDLNNLVRVGIREVRCIYALANAMGWGGK